MTRFLGAIALLLSCSSALAAPIAPLWTAEDQAFAQSTSGKGGVGLFQPLILSVHERVDLLGPSLIGLTSPRLGAKVSLIDNGRVGVAVQARVQVPTPALGLGKGWIIPSRDTVGFAVMGGVGVLVGLRGDTWRASLGLEGRIGTALGSDLQPADLFFYDTVMAPILEGPRGKARLQVDYFPGLSQEFSDGAGIRVQATAHVGGLGPDLDGKVFGLWRVGQRLVLGAGAAVAWEQLQHERSLAFAPMLDVEVRF